MKFDTYMNDGEILNRELSERSDIFHYIIDAYHDDRLKHIEKIIIHTEPNEIIFCEDAIKNLNFIFPLLRKHILSIQRDIKKITNFTYPVDMILSAIAVHFIKNNVDDLRHIMLAEIDNYYDDKNVTMNVITGNYKLIKSKKHLDDVYVRLSTNMAPIELYKK